MKKREAVAAVIVHEDRIFCARKGVGKHAYDSLKYEFPGGKIEKGETGDEAVIREVMEEIGMAVTIDKKLIIIDHNYPGLQLRMHVYLCSCENPQVRLTEHVEYRWLVGDELTELDWADAEWKVVNALNGSF